MNLNNIFNIAGFQISWWVCVLSASSSMPYLGPIVMSIFLCIHFWKLIVNYNEIKLIVIFGVIGTIIDTLLMNSGILSYNGLYSEKIMIAPLWITAMWCGFSATINHSMSWLDNKWVLSIILGFVFGPLSYLTGEKFGAIHFFTNFNTIVIVLAIIWGISIPFIYWVNHKLIRR